jgi:RimJ/RimL family protein N-acetyltransferase
LAELWRGTRRACQHTVTVRSDPDFSILTTDRLLIRRFRPEDAVAFAAYRSNPDVARYQDWDSCTRQEADDFVREMAGANPGVAGEWFQFAVADPTSDELLGDVGLGVDADDTSRAEIGFTLAPAHHGKGYATEAVERVIAYAFERLHAASVFATADARNDKSVALLERIGMRRTTTEHVRFKGGWCDEHTYELRKGEG